MKTELSSKSHLLFYFIKVSSLSFILFLLKKIEKKSVTLSLVVCI